MQDCQYDQASSQIPSANSHEEKMLMEYNIGTVDVHLENLIPPHTSRATRVLDHEHVGMLTDSFADSSCGQIVVLQGMLVDAMVSHSTLYQEGTGKVEVLGGNHSREALQTLHRKGTLPYSTVRCNLFRPLPRILALRIGYAHNAVLHEKVKPITFMDRARLMRDCRPAENMDKEEKLKWKDTLVTILGVKDRRRLIQSFNVHLAMANLQPELWTKICLAAEKTIISERLMRGFARLDDSDNHFQCLDVLIKKGVAAFKQKVKTLIDAGNVKSKKNEMKRKADETVHEVMVDVTANDENGDVPEEVLLNEDLTSWKQKYEELMVKYKQLENENSTLKKEIEEERTVEQTTVAHTVRDDKAESKRRRKSTNMFKKDEVVMAFWRDEISGEETWQEALVKFAYSDGKCRIEWKSDGMTSTAKQHELQKLV